MSAFWISAARALALITDELKDFERAKRAIIGRAAAGHVLARADAIRFGAKEVFAGPVPADFWLDFPVGTVDGDWEVGDLHCLRMNGLRADAINVAFDVDRLLSIIPVSRRGAALASLSVQSDPEWIAASAARTQVKTAGLDEASAASAILTKARIGHIAARCVMFETGPPTVQKIYNWDVPDSVWAWTDRGDLTFDWDTGTAKISLESTGTSGPAILTGVHFARAPFAAAFGLTSAPDLKPASRGGRPRAEFWEELLCAISGKIHRGELIADTAATITKAMHEWLSSKGHEAADSTVRERARLLFFHLQDGAGNSPSR